MVDSVIMNNQNMPNIGEPAEFGGWAEPLETVAFLKRMNRYLNRFKFPDDYDKILCFAGYLTDSAASWFNKLSQESLREGTYDDFIEVFKGRYYGKHEVDSIVTQLRFCKQQGSLEAYNNEFTALSAAIPDTLMSPALKLSFYLSGMERSLRITVSNLNPDSLNTAMILASNSLKEERPADWTANTDGRKKHLAEGDTLDAQTEIDAMRTGNKRRRTDPSDTRRVKLTDEDRRILRKFGICFKCRAGKHWAKNCPEARPA